VYIYVYLIISIHKLYIYIYFSDHKADVKARKTSIWDVAKAQESVKAPEIYSPTGLRLSNIDEKHTKIENDGGSVAKTQDSLRSKVYTILSYI
jgi:hypothetical protein